MPCASPLASVVRRRPRLPARRRHHPSAGPVPRPRSRARPLRRPFAEDPPRRHRRPRHAACSSPGRRPGVRSGGAAPRPTRVCAHASLVAVLPGPPWVRGSAWVGAVIGPSPDRRGMPLRPASRQVHRRRRQWGDDRLPRQPASPISTDTPAARRVARCRGRRRCRAGSCTRPRRSCRRRARWDPREVPHVPEAIADLHAGGPVVGPRVRTCGMGDEEARPSFSLGSKPFLWPPSARARDFVANASPVIGRPLWSTANGRSVGSRRRRRCNRSSSVEPGA